MTILPECSHRHPTAGPEYFCTHPKYYAAGHLASANGCAQCTTRLIEMPPRPDSAPMPYTAGAAPKPPARVGECVHKGEETRRVGCRTCRGNVQVKVFACAVWGECTASKNVGVKVCAEPCGDWQS